MLLEDGVQELKDYSMKNRLLYVHNFSPLSNKANIIQVINMTDTLSDHFDEVCLALPNYKNNTLDEYEKNILEKLGYKPKFKIILYKSNKFFRRRAKLFEPFFSIKESCSIL